jgi:hypothetical protein
MIPPKVCSFLLGVRMSTARKTAAHATTSVSGSHHRAARSKVRPGLDVLAELDQVEQRHRDDQDDERAPDDAEEQVALAGGGFDGVADPRRAAHRVVGRVIGMDLPRPARRVRAVLLGLVVSWVGHVGVGDLGWPVRGAACSGAVLWGSSAAVRSPRGVFPGSRDPIRGVSPRGSARARPGWFFRESVRGHAG